MKTVARRIARFTESVIREQTRLSHLHGAINLAQGYPDFPAAGFVKALARAAVNGNVNQYSITWGLPALREAIAEKMKKNNGIAADPEREVTVTCGATEAMAAAALSLLNPGDEVVVFEPFYENYHPDALLAGARLRHVTLHEPAWRIDESELARAFNRRTRAIVVNTPHNPTGKVFKRDELMSISRLCQKWGAVVLTDEIYEHILYDGARHVSPASIPGLEDRTVTISSASKTFGVTGWRVGWALAPPKLTAALRKVHDFLTVCAPAPLQEAVRRALSWDAGFYRALARDYVLRRDFTVAGLEKAGFRCHVPEGAYYIMTDIAGILKAKPALKDDRGLARHLVSRLKVAAVPGSSFYNNKAFGRRKLRFCFCKKRGTLAEALRRLKALQA